MGWSKTNWSHPRALGRARLAPDVRAVPAPPAQLEHSQGCHTPGTLCAEFREVMGWPQQQKGWTADSRRPGMRFQGNMGCSAPLRNCSHSFLFVEQKFVGLNTSEEAQSFLSTQSEEPPVLTEQCLAPDPLSCCSSSTSVTPYHTQSHGSCQNLASL